MLQKTEIALLGDFFIEDMKMTKEYNMSIQHYHDMYEIYLQIDGERGLFLDSTMTANAEYFHLKKGDLVVIEPFVIHYTQSYEHTPYERYVMNFASSTLNILLDENEIATLFNNIHTCVIHLDNNLMKVAYDYFAKIDEYSKKQNKLSNKLLYAELFQFVAFIGEIGENTKKSTRNFASNEIIRAMNYVKEHYGENITLKFILEYVHMSKSRFCYKFNGFTGTSFMEYLYNVRITTVHKLLLETKLPLYKIAQQTGFSSTAHMTRIFKKMHSIPPREFRK